MSAKRNPFAAKARYQLVVENVITEIASPIATYRTLAECDAAASRFASQKITIATDWKVAKLSKHCWSYSWSLGKCRTQYAYYPVRLSDGQPVLGRPC